MSKEKKRKRECIPVPAIFKTKRHLKYFKRSKKNTRTRRQNYKLKIITVANARGLKWKMYEGHRRKKKADGEDEWRTKTKLSQCLQSLTCR